ncbi:uncharacterized protein LOC108597266 [Drosophila busckii]|uniref:uncharacterized protein LOC108597266 n=1 Tax=Drosophila busckii TaxID=30019 RepID=UPI00083F2DE4|nr:uncharacterized protein LOC108597266 [Drosophila busckii]
MSFNFALTTATTSVCCYVAMQPRTWQATYDLNTELSQSDSTSLPMPRIRAHTHLSTAPAAQPDYWSLYAVGAERPRSMHKNISAPQELYTETQRRKLKQYYADLIAAERYPLPWCYLCQLCPDVSLLKSRIKYADTCRNVYCWGPKQLGQKLGRT